MNNEDYKIIPFNNEVKDTKSFFSLNMKFILLIFLLFFLVIISIYISKTITIIKNNNNLQKTVLIGLSRSPLFHYHLSSFLYSKGRMGMSRVVAEVAIELIEYDNQNLCDKPEEQKLREKILSIGNSTK